ncbi:hypothetical protein CHS0354_018863 [Potamilus streckersoni]|uniref:G-protein coupled receptors family 1 profile domain-containing protein n=1 Tax=Potamilus streckersoni TaxID=2493646 RepID=A0AAE0SC50_9BIVA|nr:hypothetical protein CHS0354_018863 [Potamilus streckersoni]
MNMTDVEKADMISYNGSGAINVTYHNEDSELATPLSMNQTIAGLLIVGVVFGSLGNFLVAVTILKNKRFRVPVYALLLQVATHDALFQVTVVPINVYSLFHSLWIPSTALCYMIVYVTFMLLCTTGLLLMLVSVYRCILVCYTNLYTKLKDPRVVTAFCVFFWVETVVLICVLGEKVHFSREYMTCVLEGANLRIVLSIVMYLPMSLIPIAMYIRIAVFVKKAKHSVLPQGCTSSRNYAESNKLTKMTALISLNHIVTGLLPGIFLTVIPNDFTMRRIFVAIAHLLFRLTAALDFLIFFLTHETIRFMIIKMFTSLRPAVTPQDIQLEQGALNKRRK